MEQKQEKKKRKYSRQTIWIAAALCAVVLYAGITMIIQRGELNARKNRNQELTAEIEELKSELEDLERQQEYVGSDAYVEKKAREEFGFVKEGEILFKVQDDGQVDVYRGDEENGQQDDSNE